MQNLHINHPLVIDTARKMDTSRFTAMAHLTALEVGIKPHEMSMYMEEFHANMANSMTVCDAIETALAYTISESINMEAVVKSCFVNRSSFSLN